MTALLKLGLRVMPELPEKIVDFHVHLFPDRLFESIWKAFSRDYKWDVVHQLYYRECIEYLNERGVDTIVYSNYAHRKGVARQLNEWNLTVLEEFPGLYCFGALHPDDDDSLAMARDFLSHPRACGFKLQLLVQRCYPHDPRLFPLYELAIERGKRILLHVGTGPLSNEFVGATHFRMLMQRYPQLQVNVAHMGAMEYREFMDMLDEYPGMYLDTAYTFFPDMPGTFDLGSECLEKHRHRIVYGSDFPNIILPRESEINTLLKHELSQEFYDLVFRQNALGLLRRHCGGTIP